MLTTIDDLFREYSDRCGSAGPVATRDQLQDDYQAWARGREVPARYEDTAQDYLDDDELGPFESDTVDGWLASSAAEIAKELREIVTEETLASFVSDESGHDSLRGYESLVETRLGWSYRAASWDDAMEVLRQERRASTKTSDEQGGGPMRTDGGTP